ncbi:hypothetical protein NFI95_08210 [Acetobacteraceae bacterium KSS8]|uniref:Uncharacterized protein n=1 Tax=Endosaccharibacter trunci TaxID=2812733 RepID=A0ABT1W6C5_9PROT|nr:hypothetical protein [Acetobacteraceae bacterium KSS8]
MQMLVQRPFLVGLLVTALPLAAAAQPAPRFAAPLQPWRSPDGHVSLLRPLQALSTTFDAPIGALMSEGWRLSWNGQPPGAGRIVVRLTLPTRPDKPTGGAGTELLQVGVSDDARVVRDCLGASFTGKPEPSRTINGVRYLVRGNNGAGMSQTIDATELRAVVGGRCYAVARLHYGVAPGVESPAPNAIPHDRAARLLDDALDSLRIAAGEAAMPVPPTMRLPAGTVAR